MYKRKGEKFVKPGANRAFLTEDNIYYLQRIGAITNVANVQNYIQGSD